jgi:hypothetical protein
MMNKEGSHQGLIAHPQKDDGAKCQECHIEDTQSRLATFSSLGGYKPVIEAGFPEISEPDLIVEKLQWLTGAFVLFGFWLALVLFSPQKP